MLGEISTGAVEDDRDDLKSAAAQIEGVSSSALATRTTRRF